MDDLMIEKYKEFQEETHGKVWRAINFSKGMSRILIILSIVGGFAGIILFALSKSNELREWALGITAVFGVEFCLVAEWVHIRVKYKSIKEYRKHCCNLSDFLNKYDFSSYGSIKLLRDRILDLISKIELRHKEVNTFLGKWIQVIVIPIILIILPIIFNKSLDFDTMEEYVLYVAFFFIVILLIGLVTRYSIWFDEKYNYEVMRCFVRDLQGIMDLHSIQEFNKRVYPSEKHTLCNSNKKVARKKCGFEVKMSFNRKQ